MNRLFEMDSHDYEDSYKTFRRPSARAVILKPNKTIALVYSVNNRYYKFPGGGIKDDEERRTALIREVKEEAGLSVIQGTIREFGSVLRRQKSDKEENTIFEQENFYYFCDCEEEIGEQNLDDYEAEAGFVLRFVSLDEAIKTNGEFRSDNQFDQLMIDRERRVLELIKEVIDED